MQFIASRFTNSDIIKNQSHQSYACFATYSLLVNCTNPTSTLKTNNFVNYQYTEWALKQQVRLIPAKLKKNTMKDNPTSLATRTLASEANESYELSTNKPTKTSAQLTASSLAASATSQRDALWSDTVQILCDTRNLTIFDKKIRYSLNYTAKLWVNCTKVGCTSQLVG